MTYEPLVGTKGSANTSKRSLVGRLALFASGVLLGSALTMTTLQLSSHLGPAGLISTSNAGAEDSSSSFALYRRDAPTAPIPDSVASREEFRFGFPAPVSDLGINKRFVTVFDRRTRNPHWAAEYLTKQNLLPEDPNSPPSREENFHPDSTIPEQFRTTLAAYSKSGFDRGHQAPAADAKVNQDALDETFVLSNMAPQVGIGFNRNYWAYLENFARDLTTRFDHVHLFTGPLYINNGTTASDGKRYVNYQVLAGTSASGPEVAVPTHFYKVILVSKGDIASPSSQALGAFILPNAAISSTKPLTDFKVPVETVEAAAGVVFFDKINHATVPKLCDTTTCAVVR
ncbi:hypothetical protein GQ42DRAFT_162000 [Ramicandelaber brevisporus]|nr:hypothetical protein GQ42DRAFT_162000 [Ramicandelaber brevisporus]